jgi:HEAT repeat protein
MLREVEVLVVAEGPVAEAAAERLVRRGAEAIAVLETGLYTAEPPARRRIIRTLERIGAPEAAPVLRHLAERDPDPDVREAAGRAFASLTHKD